MSPSPVTPRNRRRLAAAAVAGLLAALMGAAPAEAATTTAWAGFSELSGTSGAFESELTFGTAPGLTAAITSTSRSGQVGVVSGSSTWLSEGTAIGAKYGSSRNQPYLNLRPRADSAAAPSVTTYAFEAPTPSAGWAFALGDIDADAVRITAITAAGTTATADELGYRESFNYCAAGLVGKPSCTGDALDIPVWDESTTTLTGNAAALDTAGAAAWFEPNVPLTSLTFTFTRRAGFPIYQTWFASLGRDIGGTVSDADGQPVAEAALTLLDENGTTVGATTTLADGGYLFPGFTAADGYTVALARPDGRIVVGPAALTADIGQTDALDVDFAVRDIVPVPVGGTVVTTDGQPVAGVAVTISGADGTTSTTTTDAEGTYLFDTVAPDDYTVAIADVPGFAVETAPDGFSVPEDSETPITGVDFVLAALPSLSGTVTVGGTPAAGVVVTATGPGGARTTTTRADGSYSFPGLADGSYSLTATAPDGTTPVGPTTRTEVVAGADVAGVDFAFARTGTIAGVVTDTDGTPVADATVTVTGPDDASPITTDEDGAYAIVDLDAGRYTIALTVPNGFEAVSPLTRSVDITEDGEAFLTEDFVIEALAVVEPGPDPDPGPGDEDPAPAPDDDDAAPSPDQDAEPGDDDLAVTGVDGSLPLVVFGLGALLLGASATGIARHARRRH